MMRLSSIFMLFALNIGTSRAYICHLCRDEKFPGKPNGGVVILQEVVPLPKPLYTCEELYYLGLEGGIIEKYCLPLVATVKEHCECAEFNTGPPDNTWTASTPTGNTWSWNVPWNSWDLPTPSGRVPPSPTAPFNLPVSFPTNAPITSSISPPTLPISSSVNPPVPSPLVWPATNPWNPIGWTAPSPVSAPSTPSAPAPFAWNPQHFLPTSRNQVSGDAPVEQEDPAVWNSGWDKAPVQVPVSSSVSNPVSAPNSVPVSTPYPSGDDTADVSPKKMSMSMMRMNGMKRMDRALRGKTTLY